MNSFSLSGISKQHYLFPHLASLVQCLCGLCCGVVTFVVTPQPHEGLSAGGSVWVSKSTEHTHTKTIGVQSGKGLPVMLCEWPLLKQINRHWHVPPQTKRKQLKAIDPVPGSSMNMHVSLTFPCRGEGTQIDWRTGVGTLFIRPLGCNVNLFVVVFCATLEFSFLCESIHIKWVENLTCFMSSNEANCHIKACETSCSL